MSELMQNCSLCEECDSILELQTKSFADRVLLKLCEFIVISTVVLVVHLLDVILFTEYEFQKFTLSEIKLKSKSLIQIISVSVLILTIPFITVLIVIALLYKFVCAVAIKRRDKRFVHFLDSFDVFCCLDDNTTTDIQGVIQSNTIELAVDKIKEKLHNVFKNYGTDKIFYRRNEEYGFYYWRRYSFIDLAQYVQIEGVPENLDLNANQNLKRSKDLAVYNDEGLFKVLIVKNSLGDDENKYKIILKFHNSVKDGALIEFVARLIEKSDDCHLTLLSTRESQDYNSPDALVNMITKLFSILAHSLDSLKRKNNSQGSLTALKTLQWTKSDENLLCKVNNVRDNVNDLNFADIFGDAFAGILCKLER